MSSEVKIPDEIVERCAQALYAHIPRRHKYWELFSQLDDPGQIEIRDEARAVLAASGLVEENARLQRRFDYIAEHLPHDWNHCTTEKELCEQIAFIVERVAELESALRQYGRHLRPQCKFRENDWELECPCTCGLAAALANAEHKEPIL